MNVSQFPSTQPTSIQHILTEAQEEDANFLSFKLLNNRARVRLSPEPFDLQRLPGRAHLISVANHKGWFVAVSRTSTQISLILSPLSDLRAAFDSTPQDGAVLFDPKRTISLSTGIPNALAFASNDTRLLVGLIQGQILVYDTSRLFTPGTDSFPPLHVFQTSTLAASRQLLPNPGDMPELVAVLREPDGTALTQAVEILDVNNMTSVGAWTSGDTPSTTPMSISWSPKGKQIAIGLQSGDILTFSPSSTSTVKALISKPPSAGDQAAVATTWLSNPSFHAIYAPPTPINPDAEQLHYVVILDSKKGSATDIKLGAPCLPYPGLRPPGSFILTLRNWEPSRFLLCIGDSASSDIGVLGSVASSADSSGEVWHNFSLEETGRPSMPLDKDMNDTVLVGLELDLTSSQSFRHTGVSGEALELPPPPIIYAYASDGTVLGWYVVNSQGTPYPGMMISSAAASFSSPIHDASISPRAQPESISTSPAPAPSDIMSTTPTSVFDSGSTFGQPSLAAPSTFGQQASIFGQAQPAASPFGQNTSSSLGPTTGFGAFSSSGPAPFPASLGFDAHSNPSPSPVVAVSPTEDSMSSESTPSFGGLSLGGPTDSSSKPQLTFGLGPTGMFGASAQSPPDVAKAVSNSASSSGAFGAIKPATGFGAFASFSSNTSPSSTLSATSTTPASGFGRSGFDTKPSNTFGQSSFGPKSTPAFGQSSFGSAVAPLPSASSSSGGFGAFAQGGLASFGSVANSGNSSGANNFGSSTFGSTSSKTSELGGNTGQSSVFGGDRTAFGSSQPKASGDVFGGGSTFLGSKSVSDPTVQPTGGSNVFGGGSFAVSGAKDSLSSEPASNNPSDAFGQQPNVDTMSRKDPSLSPKTGSPTMVILSAPTSPVLATKAASPFGSIESTPSPFKSSSPTPGFGAFGQLKSSNHGFIKPAEGFGAFGGSPSAQSPFLNPPKAEEIKPVSVFGAAPPKTATLSTPTFGSTSAIGPSTRSQFGSMDSPPAALPKATASTSGGFAAFSGSSSTFGQLAGSKKSFTELLKGGDDAKDPTKPSTVPSKEPADALSSKEKDEPKEAHLPADGKAPALLESSKLSPSSEDKKTLSSELSSVSLSSSDSSFVEVAASGDEVLEPTANETVNESDFRSHNGESDQHDLEDDTESFLSDSQSEGSSEENPEGETILDMPTPEETELTTPAKPRSATRSPSTTPKADPAKIDIRIPSPPPSVPIISQPEVELSSSDASTTPPGSPAKVTPALGVLAKTPPPVLTTTASGTTTPSGLGLGRPSTRPARSSPLASVAPLSGATDEEEVLPMALTKPTIAAPKSSFGILPTFIDSTKPALRPKTPPLLSAMPTPKPFSLDTPSSTSTPSKQPGDTIVTPSSTQGSEPPALFTVPSTPASLSSFGAKLVPSPSPSAGLRADSAPPPTTPPSFSLLGNRSSLSSSSSSISGVQAPASSSRPLNLFGPRPPEATPSAPSSFPDVSSGNSAPSSIFSNKASTPLATSTGAFGTQPSSVTSNKLATTSPAPGSKASFTPSLVSPAPEPNREQGMQTEYLHLFVILSKELEGLKALAQDVSKRTIELGKPLAGHCSKADLGDPSKWGLGDIVLYGQTLKQLESDIAELERQRVQQILILRKLESGMLKAKTRQEEILRFKNARKDAEFAKMLKLRSLGPEHIETQMQLRRDIRTMDDRVEKLEDKLEESKKKLNEVKLGKPTFRPPSLDTINRVCRQIDIAVAQRTEEMAKLSARIAEIHLSSEGLPSSTRDKRLPEASFKKPVDVTPNIAVSTAAALNAERSAQKLKRALLSVRQEPLLNTRAASAPIPPVAFTTPQKASEVKPESIAFDLTSLAPTTFATPNQPIPQDWTLSATPAYNESPSPSLRIRSSGGTKHHTKPVPLRKSAGSGQSPTPAPTFDWGPLATVRPMAMLSADVRPRENTES